ncbi:glycosyltransferase family 4 protein [Longitalea luteola]|uniref:glycosyltransferase family 4 protein n=1 Tax=Longitalea luteola TaxID=2812563 RepID=UPI001A97295C|nr:glycosyltransferase family 4 protein [Longitalea luteola]
MERKPVLSFYTNMPTPYQLDFIEALKECFELRVIYFTVREADRQWQLSTTGKGYSVVVLKNSRFAIWMQKRVPSFHFSRKIISLLRKDDADYVLVNGTYWSPNVILALYISYRKKKKVSFWSEPVFPVKSPFLFLIKKIMLFPVMRYTHFLLAIGKQAVDGYRKYGYKKDIHNIPYNINSRLFAKENLQQAIFEKLVQQYKPGSGTVLLTSGSLIHRKGMDTIIRAFLQLPDSLNVCLLIMGDGEQKDDLKALCNNDHRIHFLGFQEKHMIPYWFSLADIFVFASRYDGWGLVINEAVASETAIICSKSVGAATDKLIDQYSAILVEADDIPGFSAAMQKLVKDKQSRERIISNSASLKQELSSDYNAKKVFDIYRSTQ